MVLTIILYPQKIQINIYLMRDQTCFYIYLEVGFSAAQKQAFFDKLQIFIQNWAWYWICFFSRMVKQISKWTMSSSLTWSLTCLGKNFHINLPDCIPFFSQNKDSGKLSVLSISKEVLALEYLKKLSYFMGVKMKLHKIVVCMLSWKEISKRCESLAIALQPHL